MIDPLSPTWLAVAEECAAAMEGSRLTLESIGAQERTSDHHRGMIAMARRIMALAEPPVMDDEDTGDD